MGKLQEQLKRDMALKRYSPRTRACYLAWVKDFVRYYGRSPEALGTEEIKAYLHGMTLVAAGVSDADGAVVGVQFWRDVVGDGIWDEALDDLLGVDEDGSDGWSLGLAFVDWAWDRWRWREPLMRRWWTGWHGPCLRAALLLRCPRGCMR